MATLSQDQKQLVQEKAKAIRVSIVQSVTAAKSGHPGGSLSIADVMSLLYFVEMNVDPSNPKKQDRDRFVLSKGHAAPALYATLAEKGYFSKSELINLRKINHFLQGHPDMKHTPGVDMSTGSLGQGISAACGMALAGKIDYADYRVYSILGDGELEEGQVWEAAMFAGHYKLNNLTAFVDYNGLQIDGDIEKVMSPLPIPDKFKAFKWNVIEVNGHNIDELHQAIEEAKAFTDGPTCIVMHTVKGKGVVEMNVDPSNPKKQDRDRFVLSKGHAAPALYATLAEKGYFPKSELINLRKINHFLQGHPDMKHTPGVDMSTGSLGQGISAACGMALAGKIDNADYRVYSILGDGELEEGQVWEAAMFAGHYKLNNLTAFVDYNGLQIDGDIEKVMSPLPIPDKFKAFKWNVIEVNGHDIDELHQAIQEAKAFTEGPTCIVMHTVKGKGVAEMEGQAGWHGKAPSEEQGVAFVNEIMGVQ